MSTLLLRNLRTTSMLHSIQITIPQHSFTQASTISLLRHASTSTTTANATKTSLKTSSPTPRTSLINGPLSTLPAPLELPTRRPNQPFFPTYAFNLGKAYATFYKTGLKNIYYNYKTAHKIQSRLDAAHHSTITKAVHANSLSRSEFQLLIRNWHDIKRIPIFALVFLICGEFTPLVVIALSNVVPWTCRIPKQVTSDRLKLESRRSISFRNLTSPPPSSPGVKEMSRMQLLHINWSLGLSSSIWDYLGGQLPGLPTFLLRRRVGRRVEYLELDDGLIGKAGGIKGMEEEECRMALVDRGVDILGKNERQLKELLGAWLKSREKAPVERLLLTRPSVWPVRPISPKTTVL